MTCLVLHQILAGVEHLATECTSVLSPQLVYQFVVSSQTHFVPELLFTQITLDLALLQLALGLDMRILVLDFVFILFKLHLLFFHRNLSKFGQILQTASQGKTVEHVEAVSVGGVHVVKQGGRETLDFLEDVLQLHHTNGEQR